MTNAEGTLLQSAEFDAQERDRSVPVLRADHDLLLVSVPSPVTESQIPTGQLTEIHGDQGRIFGSSKTANASGSW
jgi:hypothetical protein